MPLTDLAVKNARPIDKTRRLYDAGGLYLEVSPAGSKLWPFKYRYDRREKRLSFGKYPDVTLKDARAKRDEARRLLADDVDPGEHKKAVKAARLASATSNFEAVTREWFERMMADKARSHKDKVIARLENDIFPWLGKRPISDITAPEILACLRRIEARGARDTAHRALQNCAAVFRYAVAIGKACGNPADRLRGALPPAKPGHLAAVTEPEKIGPLLRKMDEVNATFPVQCALRLAPYPFCRPIELRTLRWTEVNLDAADWRYMVGKTQTPHLVPLATQAVAILRELQPLTGRWDYVCPGRDDKKQLMSGNTVNVALKRAGTVTQPSLSPHSVMGGGTLPAANGLTTAQMSNPANFDSSWDFSSTGAWAMPVGATHPVLRWQLAP